jgi:hypothetical protein
VSTIYSRSGVGPSYQEKRPGELAGKAVERRSLADEAIRFSGNCCDGYLFYFHKHRGKELLTNLFSSTSWQDTILTFFLYLFSTTSWHYPSFFISPFFPPGTHLEK